MPSGAVCRWCGREEPALRCARCGSDAVRAVVVGARRTAEELGRAFPGTTVVTSGGDTVMSTVPGDPALVVATPGAEPVGGGRIRRRAASRRLGAAGPSGSACGRGHAAPLDGRITLVRCGGDGGVVAAVAESTVPTVQALIRWDPVGHAEAELDARDEVGLPPAVHMAAVDGAPEAVAALLETAELPDSAELLGPVDLPSGARRPPGTPAASPVSRMLVRVPRTDGLELAAALRRATGVLSARHDQQPVRVQIDPLHIG